MLVTAITEPPAYSAASPLPGMQAIRVALGSFSSSKLLPCMTSLMTSPQAVLAQTLAAQTPRRPPLSSSKRLHCQTPSRTLVVPNRRWMAESCRQTLKRSRGG